MQFILRLRKQFQMGDLPVTAGGGGQRGGTGHPWGPGTTERLSASHQGPKCGGFARPRGLPLARCASVGTSRRPVRSARNLRIRRSESHDKRRQFVNYVGPGIYRSLSSARIGSQQEPVSPPGVCFGATSSPFPSPLAVPPLSASPEPGTGSTNYQPSRTPSERQRVMKPGYFSSAAISFPVPSNEENARFCRHLGKGGSSAFFFSSPLAGVLRRL